MSCFIRGFSSKNRTTFCLMFTVIHGLRWQYNYAVQRLKSRIKVIVSFGGCLIIAFVFILHICMLYCFGRKSLMYEWMASFGQCFGFFLAIMPHHMLIKLCHVNIIFFSYRQARERSANDKRQCKQSMPEWHLETYLFSRRCQSRSDFISVVSKWHWCWGKQHKNVG